MQKLFIVIGLIFLVLGISLPGLSQLGIEYLSDYFLIKRDNFTFLFSFDHSYHHPHLNFIVSPEAFHV